MAKLATPTIAAPPAPLVMRGDPLTGEFLTRALRRVHDGVHGFRPPVQATTLGRSAVRRFRVKSVGVDLLVCRTWDGTTEGGTDVDVALPYLLRKTPYDGLTVHGVAYTYTSNVARDATPTGGTLEEQEIFPAYEVDEEIYSARAIGGTGVADCDWLDLNCDARAWAAPLP